MIRNKPKDIWAAGKPVRMAIASVQNVLDYFDRNIDPKLVVNHAAAHA